MFPVCRLIWDISQYKENLKCAMHAKCCQMQTVKLEINIYYGDEMKFELNLQVLGG